MRVDQAWARLHEAADLAAARGSLLFHLDLASAVARAALTEQDITFAGLATLVDERGYRVIAMNDAPLRRAVAEVSFDPSGAATVWLDPVGVPPRAATIADAYVTATAAHDGMAVAQATIVIPAHDPARPIEAYAVAIAQNRGTVQLTGHALVTLDPAGRRILSRELLAVATGQDACSAHAARDAVLVIPDAVPSELHTYLSLKHGVPLTIETRQSGVRWRVDGERTSRA